MSTLGKAFVAMYPYFHTTWEGTILAYQTAYLFGKSDWHSPLLHYTGVMLCNDMETEGGSHVPTFPQFQQLR